MAKRISQIANSLKQLGEIQVAEWDFMGLLNTEIRELEISRSLRRLGRIQVTDWDFRSVLPGVKKAANQEVDLIDFFKRTANYKVMEWDFRGVIPPQASATPSEKPIHGTAMPVIRERLKNFLQYAVVHLIDQPEQAQIKVTALGPSGLRLKLVMTQKDVAMLIGREGHTAAALRSILKASAARDGVQVLLQIHSHQEELAFLAKEQARRRFDDSSGA